MQTERREVYEAEGFVFPKRKSINLLRKEYEKMGDEMYPDDRNKVPERHGHPRFYAILEELAQLHSDKNHDYAIGGDPLGNFNRVAKILGMYPGLDMSDPSNVALVYMLKQLDATLWMKSNKHTAKCEGTIGRLQDVAVYAMIDMILEEIREMSAGMGAHAHGMPMTTLSHMPEEKKHV